MTADADDYLTVHELRERLASLPPDVPVALDARSVRFRTVLFSGRDDAPETSVSVCDPESARCNAVDFARDAPPSTAAELLALLGGLPSQRKHAAVTLDGQPLLPFAPGAVPLPRGARGLAASTFNVRHAALLLTRRAAPDAPSAWTLLCERYGQHAAFWLQLYAVGARWYTHDGLLARYPRLAAQEDWERLFPRGERPANFLRRCVADDDELLDAFGPPITPLERLLTRHGIASPSTAADDQAKSPHAGRSDTADVVLYWRILIVPLVCLILVIWAVFR